MCSSCCKSSFDFVTSDLSSAYLMFYMFTPLIGKTMCSAQTMFSAYIEVIMGRGKQRTEHVVFPINRVTIYSIYSVRSKISSSSLSSHLIASSPNALKLSMGPLSRNSKHPCMMCRAFGDSVPHLHREPFHFVFSTPVLSQFN